MMVIKIDGLNEKKYSSIYTGMGTNVNHQTNQHQHHHNQTAIALPSPHDPIVN
jgi:predicted GIY-YIG superfamily endonuclease